ncbi:hypothetical protein K7472_32120 [Streptomyces sp. PTM05]|uniref:Uncharacterized protein n=1 Tax=Streptantibioticus parmotrematis TaxID=2873249 RepID=A0ABS7R1V2_9ACTN|nr:hypothetical protein [Streptantibioticus parmotrematis]MBY8889448.1 hypothetical protein [Streptantibioticus parmotrematis]
MVEREVELIEFICPRCAHRWTRAYDLVHCESPSGEVRDYYGLGGLFVVSPYSPEGAPSCPVCAWRAVGRRAAARVAEGGAAQPEEPLESGEIADREVCDQARVPAQARRRPPC